MRKYSLPAFLMLALVLQATPSFAVDADDTLADPALRERYETVTRELRCLVCQNQTIADSDADLAKDLRREVREMLVAGQTDEQIRTFMTDRYGDFVLYRPRANGRTWILWAAPAILLLGGLFLIFRIARRRALALAEATPDPDDSLADELPPDRKA
jgi:cytochrome c-type biogenesis protein CcmH